MATRWSHHEAPHVLTFLSMVINYIEEKVLHHCLSDRGFSASLHRQRWLESKKALGMQLMPFQEQTTLYIQQFLRYRQLPCRDQRSHRQYGSSTPFSSYEAHMLISCFSNSPFDTLASFLLDFLVSVLPFELLKSLFCPPHLIFTRDGVGPFRSPSVRFTLRVSL